MRAQETEKKVEGKTKLIKRNASIIKMKAGEKFEGTFKGKTTGPWIDPNTGEESELTRLHFVNPKSGERLILFEDAGLRNALANAMVVEGEHILIEKLEKVELKGGRTCNQYDIFAIQPELN